MSDSLFEAPFYFIGEYLNGWVILILIIIIIYFVALRNYYLKKEKFYDQSMQLKEMNEIEDNEDQINNDYNGMQNDETNIDTNTKPLITKSNNKIINKKKIIKSQNNQNKVKLKGTEIFEGFEVSTTKASAKGTSAPTNPLSINLAKGDETLVSTTLFNNLDLNDKQIKSCLMNYNEVINKYISDLQKLNDLKNKNEYLNVKKQFDGIISKGIDNIVNYLNNVIKSPNILTRTSIRTDVINTLSTNIENLINKSNNDLSSEINKLALLNSTTIDYKNMTTLIDDSRSKIENYIELDKLVSKYGRNLSNYDNNINNTLNKLNILPIYERNFDRINQLLKSDYNDDETKMSNKYGKAYTDYLEQMKKEDLDVNPMRLASQIESGIVNMLSNLYGSSNKYGNTNNNSNRTNMYNDDNEDIIEQYNREYGNNNTKINNVKSNIIPSQQSKLVNNTNLNENANIYKDRGNLGSYLIDSKTQKKILEGFADETTTTNPETTKGARGAEALVTTNPETTKGALGAEALVTTNPSTTKGARGAEALVTDYVSKNKKTKKTADIISSLLSGDFLQYIMEVMNDKLNMIYGMYNTKFNNSDNSKYDKNGNKSNDTKNIYGNFKLEENMIPAGFLLFIISMLVYFVDTTS